MKVNTRLHCYSDTKIITKCEKRYSTSSHATCIVVACIPPKRGPAKASEPTAKPSNIVCTETVKHPLISSYSADQHGAGNTAPTTHHSSSAAVKQQDIFIFKPLAKGDVLTFALIW